MKKIVVFLLFCTLCALTNTSLAQEPFEALAHKYVARATECFKDTVANLEEMTVLTPKGVRYLVRNEEMKGVVVYWWVGDTISYTRMLDPKHVRVLKERTTGELMGLIPDEERDGIISDMEIVTKDISYVMWYAQCPIE